MPYKLSRQDQENLLHLAAVATNTLGWKTDAVAVARLYDSGVSLASYVASTNPTWAAEAQAFVAWRDAVWSQVYGMWASPPDPVPTPEEVVAGLPVIEWPGVQE